MHRHTARATVRLMALLFVALPAIAHAQTDGGTLGATAESLLAVARQLSPSVRAAALETEAAIARADAAGALPDPTFMINDDEVDRTGGPRINKTYFMFGQTFPLWGKRDLQRGAAQAAVDAARGRERATVDELDERIKTGFARYYAVYHALAVNREVTRLARQMTDAAAERYAQSAGDQASVILAQTEETRAATERVRLQAELRTAVARLNALLARPATAPLAAPDHLRALPRANLNIAELAGLARASNARLASMNAEIRGAATERRLAGKAWYPDVTITAGPVERANGPTGVSATLSFSIPLQQGPKDAGVREAVAKLQAASRSRDAALAEIEGDLGEAVASLDSARQTEALLRGRLLPQYQAAYRSAIASYVQGRGGFNNVLEAEHRLHDTNLDLLRVQTDAQTALASIERLIGSNL